jgi:hypothetical protein
MVLTKGKSLIKSLQALPRGVPFGSDELKALGVSSALASHYGSVVRAVESKLGRRGPKDSQAYGRDHP